MAIKKIETPTTQTTQEDRYYFKDVLDTYHNKNVKGVKTGQRFLFIPFNRISLTDPYETITGVPSSTILFNRIVIMPDGTYKSKVNSGREDKDQIKSRMFVFPEIEEYSVYNVLHELGTEYENKTTTDQRKAEILSELNGISKFPSYMVGKPNPMMLGFAIPLYEGAKEGTTEYNDERRSYSNTQKFEDVSPFYYEPVKGTLDNLSQTLNNWMISQEEAGNIYNSVEEIEWYNTENPASSRGILFQRNWDGAPRTKNLFTSIIVNVDATQIAASGMAEKFVNTEILSNPNITVVLPHLRNDNLEKQFETAIHLGMEQIILNSKLKDKFNTYLQNTGNQVAQVVDNQNEEFIDVDDDGDGFE